MPEEFRPDLPLRLLDVKNLQDKINETQEQLVFMQVFINTLFYQLFSETPKKMKSDKFKGLLPIFFNSNKINNADLNYYIPQNMVPKFDALVAQEQENVKFEIIWWY